MTPSNSLAANSANHKNHLIKEDQRTCFSRFRECMRTHFFLATTLISVALGVTTGCLLRIASPSRQIVDLIEMPGEIFMRCLRLLILPMMIATIITGSANLSGKAQGKMAGLTFTIFLATSFASAMIGLFFVTTVHPGKVGMKEYVSKELSFSVTPTLLDTFLDLIRNAFPENLVEACVDSGYSSYKVQNITSASGWKIISQRIWKTRSGTNSLGLIVFCISFGGALGSMGQEVLPLRNFFVALDAVIMKLVSMVMWLTPVGVFSLLCAKIVSVENIAILFHQMALFIGTVLAALSVELFVVETLLYFILTRKNPIKFLGEMAYPGTCAFAVAASGPVMPITMKTLEEKCGVDSRVTRFVIPVGTTVNMNGTACFITVATVFIAQMNDISLGLGDYIAVIVTATAVSIASTSVPSAALFLMAMTLSVVGAPLTDVSLLFTTEWLLDRARTVNNCLGDAFTAAIVDHYCIDHSCATTTCDTESETEISEQLKIPVV